MSEDLCLDGGIFNERRADEHVVILLHKPHGVQINRGSHVSRNRLHLEDLSASIHRILNPEA